MRRIPVWVRRTTVLALHDLLIREHGGRPGCRDLALLDSILDQPQRTWEENRRTCVWETAAVYAQGVCRKRPFHDGNKRTGFLLAGLFLERNGHKLTVEEADAVVLTLALASGRLTIAKYAAWLRGNRRSPSAPRS